MAEEHRDAMIAQRRTPEARLNLSIKMKGRRPALSTILANSKKFKIVFPDGHEEIIINLRNFCRINDFKYQNFYLSGKNKQIMKNKYLVIRL